MIKQVISSASVIICTAFFFTACKKDDRSLRAIQSQSAVNENSTVKRDHVTIAGTYIPKYLPFYNPQQVVDYGEIYFLKMK